MSVSKGRTPRCGVRYTRKKLPLALPGAEKSATPGIRTHPKPRTKTGSFLGAPDSAAFAPELPMKETTLEQPPHQLRTPSKTGAYRDNCRSSFLEEFVLDLAAYLIC